MAPGRLIPQQFETSNYTSEQTQINEDRDLEEPIAIIGFALKFPQDAATPESFWQLMAEARSAMTEWPPERLNIDAFYHPRKRAGLPVRGGHFIAEDLGAFDADFFSITPSEAASMDPQQRLLLETSFRAFESAGISMESLSGSNTSVHTGCFTLDYEKQLLADPQQMSTYTATGVGLMRPRFYQDEC